MNNPIFIIGTGRSGTHWLAKTLEQHSKIRATIEVRPMFQWSTEMAMDPSLEPKLFQKLVDAYKQQITASAPRLYLDKSHPNIWLVEKLKQAFPNALFIGIERNPYATVASMLQHKGVSLWHERWKKYPIPNRFLGITTEIAKNYNNIPRAAQCAMRWLAHYDRMNELKKSIKSELLVVPYETFSLHPTSTVKQLQTFIGLDTPIAIPEIKSSSLSKWKTYLTKEQKRQIKNIVGDSYAPL